MKGCLRKCYAVLRAEMHLQASFRMVLLLNAVAIVMGLFAYFYLAKMFERGGVEQEATFTGGYFAFLVIGVATFQFMNIALGTFSNHLRQQQVSGVLDHLFLSRTPLRWVLMFGLLSAVLYGLMQFLAYLLISRIAFSMNFSLAQLARGVVVLVVLGIAFIPWAFLSAAFVIFFKRNDATFVVLSGASSLLAGVYFPTSLLPESLGTLAKCLPLTFANRVLREVFIGDQPLVNLTGDFLGLALLTLGLFPVAWAILEGAIIRARRRGSLSV